LLYKNKIVLATLTLLLSFLLPTFSYSTELPLKHRNLAFQKIQLDQYDSDYENTSLFQDSIGYIWIGSADALFRYDGFQTTEFTTPVNAGINAIGEINGHLILGTNNGLYTIDNEKKELIPINSEKLQDPMVISIAKADDNSLWIGSRLGIVVMTDFNKITPVIDNTSIAIDSMAVFGNNILAATRGGLFAFSQETKNQVALNTIFPNIVDFSFAKEAFFTIHVTQSNQVWLGAQVNGAYYLEKNSKEATHLTQNNAGLASNYIWGIASDNQGNIWLSSRSNGLSILAESKPPAINFQHADNLKHSIVDDAVVALLKDKKGNIWVGSEKGVSVYHHWQNILHHYRPNEYPAQLANININKILADTKRHGYWIASFEGLYFLDKATAKVTQITNKAKPITLINTLAIDSIGSLWAGSDNGLYTVKENEFLAEEMTTDKGSIKEVVDFRIQANGDVWAMTWAEGAHIFNSAYQHKLHIGKANGIPSDRLIDGIVLENEVLIASWKGVSLFTRDFHLIKNYPYHKNSKKPHFMSNFKVKNKHQISFDYELGAMLFDLKNKSFTKTEEQPSNFSSERYGLEIKTQSRNFKLDKNFAVPSSTYFAQDGLNQLVASEFGIAKLITSNIPEGELKPPMLFTSKGKNLSNLLTIPYSEGLTLKANSFLFAPPIQTSFQYKLNTFDNEWIQLDSGNTINLGILPHGEHELAVRTKSGAHAWSPTKKLTITVTPPWWYSNIAYLLYVIATLLIAFFIYKQRIKKIYLYNEKLKQEVEKKTEQLKVEKSLVTEQATHLRKISKEKTHLFETISHELRTPITLILGPIQQLRKKISDKELITTTTLIERNATRLNRLVNQLLDLSRTDSVITEIAGQTNISDLVKNLVSSFKPYATDANIKLTLNSCDDLFVGVSHDDTEKLLSNLLSNAIKYSESNDSVKITIRKDGKLAIIAVEDTGIGVKPDQIPNIFTRFYRADIEQTKTIEGSGIGLSIVKNIVDKANGIITVDSELGKGTSFTVKLPISIKVPTANPIESIPPNKDTSNTLSSDLPHLLLIDDNEDILTYVSSVLANDYDITTAPNGKEGIISARNIIPDIIISDCQQQPKSDPLHQLNNDPLFFKVFH
jgi:signal transduction histidine kinase/ligand-binding sensor domain-containing protein